MSPAPNHISYLYENHPRLYNSIANDRDFKSEIDRIIHYLGFVPEVALETFAGEAKHARQLHERGVESYALDRSKGMQPTSFASENYAIGELPDAVDIFGNGVRFDLILAMRFGIGHLDPDQLKSFLERARDVLSNHGVIALEIHCGLAPGHQFTDLEILERTTQSEEYGEVKCSWPYGRISWQGNKATMQVKISYTKPLYTVLNFQAPEFIYNEGGVVSMLGDLGMEARVLNFSSYSRLVLANVIDTKPK